MYKVTLINGRDETVIHHPSFNKTKIQNGVIKQGINQVDSFSFSILPNNPGYDLIHPMSTLVDVLNLQTNKYDFRGRVLTPTSKMNENGVFHKSFLCESKMGYMNDSAQRHGEYHNMTPRNFLQVIIDNHNKDVSKDKQIKLGEVTVTNSTDNVYRYLGYDSTLDTIFDKLVDRLGGELRLRDETDGLYLDYLEKIGSAKPTEIRLSKNLKSIELEVDPSQIITRLIPLGSTIESEDETATDASQARITIKTVNNGLDYIDDTVAIKKFGIFAKSHVWDDINSPTILKTRGQQFLSSNNRVRMQYIITALDLSLIGLDTDQFEVGNDYPVINPVMGIDDRLRVVSKTIDIINPNQNDLVFGDRLKKASDYQNETNKTQATVVNLQSTVVNQTRKIGSLTVELETTKKSLQQTQENMNNFEGSTIEGMAAITEAILTIDDAINNLNEIVSGLQGVITVEEKQQMQEAIAKNASDISAMNNQIIDLTNRVVKLEEGGGEIG